MYKILAKHTGFYPDVFFNPTSDNVGEHVQRGINDTDLSFIADSLNEAQAKIHKEFVAGTAFILKVII